MLRLSGITNLEYKIFLLRGGTNPIIKCQNKLIAGVDYLYRPKWMQYNKKPFSGYTQKPNGGYNQNVFF